MTVSSFITLVLDYFPGQDSTTVLSALQQVHDDLCERYMVRRKTVYVDTLVAGTSEYNLPTTSGSIINITSAIYQATSNTGGDYPLEPTTVVDMNYEIPTWQTQPNSQPVRYMVDGGEVGASSPRLVLFPAPNLTSSASYPRVRLDCSMMEVLTTSGSPSAGQSNVLPPNCGINAWLYGTLCKLSEKLNDERYAIWKSEATAAERELSRYFAKAQEATARTRFTGFMSAKRK